MTRATLSEIDGLSATRDNGRMPHPVELSKWQAWGWIEIDADQVFRLTDAGRKRVKNSCGSCKCWRPDGEGYNGYCWSGDRLDGDLSRGPAGASSHYEVCEAFMPKDDAETAQ